MLPCPSSSNRFLCLKQLSLGDPLQQLKVFPSSSKVSHSAYLKKFNKQQDGEDAEVYDNPDAAEGEDPDTCWPQNGEELSDAVMVSM